MATENLKVKITADAAQAKAEIGKFKDSLKETVGSAEKAASAALKLKSALAALAAVKVAKAMIQNAVSVAAAGDAIKDNAQKVFMGTTAYQEWGYVLEQNGVQMSALKMGMRQFAQQVANGSDSLAKYGITATDVDTAFQQAVYTIQNMSTETEKIAAATELFGSRALELFPILNLTNAETQNLMNTYRAIGGTMSNELIAASDVCTDSITEMKAAWGGLRNLLAAYVIPVVTKVVQWITVAIAKIRILLAAILGVKETFGGGSKKTSLPGSTASVATNTGNTAKNLKQASKHAKELKRTLMGIDELSKLAEQATASAASSPSGGGGGGVSTPAVSVGDAGSFDGIISEDTLAKIQAFQEKIDKVKEKLNGAYLILKGVTEIVLGNPVQGFKDLKDGIEKLFPGIDTLKAKWAEIKAQIADKVLTAKAALEDKVSAAWTTIKSVWDTVKSTIGGAIQTAKAVLEDKFSSAWNTVKTTWSTVKSTIGGKTQEAIASLKDKFSGTWDTVKSAWAAAKKVKGTISATLKLKLKNSFSKAWNKVKKAWNSVTDKTATLKISFSNLLSSAWNKLADKVNAAKQKAPAIIANILPTMPKLAKGGVLTAPTPAWLGEYAGARANPEIAAPQSLMYETIQRANGDLVSAFASMTQQVVAAIENKDIDVRIGDEQIARSAQRGNTAYRNRTGKALLTY